MNEFFKDYAPYQAKVRSDAIKDFISILIENAEKIDISGIEDEHQPISGAIAAIEMLITDCLTQGLAIMCPARYVWGWNGRWFKLDPNEAHKFLGDYLKACGVPQVERKLINQAANYLMQISKGLDLTLETFQRKVAPIAKRSEIPTLKVRES